MAGRGSWDDDRWDQRGRDDYESREPRRLGGRPDPSYRADYPDRDIVGDGDAPYADYGRAFSGYGAGGGYTPDYREGFGRDGRGRSQDAADAVRVRSHQASPADHRGRGPKGYTRSDDRIREDVSDRLTDDPIVDASEIEVSVSGGEVTLNGAVHSKAAKRRAEDCADDVTGVRHVQNNLRISHQPGALGAQTDPRIAAVSEGRDADEAARELTEDRTRLGALRSPDA